MKSKASGVSSAKSLQRGGQPPVLLTTSADASLTSDEIFSPVTPSRLVHWVKLGHKVQALEDNRLELFFDTPAQRDEAIAVLQHLPQLHHEHRQRSVDSSISFFEDKPEIYNHDSLAFHILQNARMRHEFMREVGALTSQEVAELSQSQAKNRAAHAHRAKTENKLFAVEYQGDQRYPAFQFDAQTGKPKPIIKRILETLNGQWSGWQLALWFVTPNGYLDDQTPMDRLDASPEAVMEALRKEAGEVEF